MADFFGEALPEDQEPVFDGVQDAYVSRGTASDLHFVVPDYDPKFEFGPAPYPRPSNLTTDSASGHTHDIDLTPTNVPPKGTRLAVAFVGGDPDRPLVLTIYGWP